MAAVLLPVIVVTSLTGLQGARQGQGRINHHARLTGAIAGLAFVGLTDPGAFARALRSVFG